MRRPKQTEQTPPDTSVSTPHNWQDGGKSISSVPWPSQCAAILNISRVLPPPSDVMRPLLANAKD
ncbi:hypothetical protein AtDm6_2919 [Acetobacter tropicalis]|uniref:Uncharacterized protein n=1 Tax=Acetobacter tropicalis TaxID=104102 RepID=A0A095AX28_9PROT|nr:hypothetical protein AtDm6_2919 [Acetobacter tropicalis]